MAKYIYTALQLYLDDTESCNLSTNNHSQTRRQKCTVSDVLKASWRHHLSRFLWGQLSSRRNNQDGKLLGDTFHGLKFPLLSGRKFLKVFLVQNLKPSFCRSREFFSSSCWSYFNKFSLLNTDFYRSDCHLLMNYFRVERKTKTFFSEDWEKLFATCELLVSKRAFIDVEQVLALHWKFKLIKQTCRIAFKNRTYWNSWKIQCG